jgi:dihydropteroate synthase
VAVAELEVLLPRLTRMPPLKKMMVLYKLRGSLDDESFRHLAALLAIDLSRGENPRRWARVDEVEEVPAEPTAPVEELVEKDVDEEEIVEDPEYVGKRIVERLWR